MSGTYFALNQKYNTLKNQITAGGGGGVADLDLVLTNGNSAGSSDIDMNGNDIIGVDSLNFSDSSQQNTAYISKNYFRALPTGATDILLEELQSNYNASYSNVAGNRRLNLPTTGLSETSYINVYNTSPSLPFVLNTDFAGRTFTGRFGTTTDTVAVRPLNWVKVAYNTTTTNWEIFDKSFVNTQELNLTVNLLLLNQSICNTLFRILSSVSDLFLFIPDLTLRPNNANGYAYYENASDNTITLRLAEQEAPVVPSTTNTFVGLYGSQTNGLLLPPRTQVTVFAGLASSNAFTVQQRFPAVFTYTVPYSGTNITAFADPQYFDTEIYLTGSVATTFFLPDPQNSVNAYSINRRITIKNQGSGIITLNSTYGFFQGYYGSIDSTLIVLPNVTVNLYCNGLEWEVQQRFPLVLTYPIAYSGTNITAYANPQFFDTILILDGTTDTNFFLPDPFSGSSFNRRVTVQNEGEATVILNATTGDFQGTYGSFASTLNVLPNVTVNLYCNGSDWEVEGKTSTFYPVSFSGTYTTFEDDRSILESTLLLTATGSLSVFVIPTPAGGTPNKNISRTLTITNEGSLPFSISASDSSDFLGRYGSGADTYIIPVNTTVEIFSNGTNWEVQDKTMNTAIDLLVGGILDWTTNLSYLDSEITICSADGALNSANTLAGTASFGSNTLTVTALTTGRLTVGSVVFLGTQRITIVTQFTSTAVGGVAGDIGTYGTGGGGVSVVSQSFTGFFNANTSITGTVEMANNQFTAVPVATLTPTVGIGSLTEGSAITTNPNPLGNTINFYTLNNPNSGGTGAYQVSRQGAAIGAPGAPFFGTQGNQIQLPPPASASGRQIKFFNENMLPCYITTSAGTAVFGGQWGQQVVISGTITYSTNYLLRSGRSVTLQSDGTRWNATDATQGSVVFSTSSASATSATDNTAANITGYIPINYNDCNISGLSIIGVGDATAANRTGFVNNTGYTINLLVSLNILWGNPTGGSPAGTYVDVYPARRVSLIQSTGAFGRYNNITDQILCPNVTTTIPVAPIVYVQAAGQFPQWVSAIPVVLAPGDSFVLQIFKVTGVSGTEQCNAGNNQFYIRRIS